MSAEREGWYALRPDNGTIIFELNPTNMPPILVDPGLSLTLAGRTMLKIAAQDLQRIVVKGEGRDETVERKAAARAGLWTAADGVADSEALQAWALALARLRAAAVSRLGADTQTLAAFGLDKPWLEITIDVNSNSALRHMLVIGRPAAKGGRYATVRGHNVVYEMSAETVALFDRHLTVR